MKSICDLARHPLHMRDHDDNFIEEIVHFVLTYVLYRIEISEFSKKMLKFIFFQAVGT